MGAKKIDIMQSYEAVAMKLQRIKNWSVISDPMLKLINKLEITLSNCIKDDIENPFAYQQAIKIIERF